jgi:hypothetical protein
MLEIHPDLIKLGGEDINIISGLREVSAVEYVAFQSPPITIGTIGSEVKKLSKSS